MQDGAARGFAVHLEEAIALAQPEPDAQPAAFTPTRTLIGKELRRHKDLLVASSGARLRFTKKQGFVFTQRDRGPTSVDCVWFEARRDQGSLDDFVPALDERARLFSARSLQAIEYAVGDGGGRLVLDGRLGRGPIGWPLRLVLAAHADDERLRLTVHLGDAMPGFRVRVRWLGIGAERVQHECMPVREVVANDHGGFVADTLVRAATTLLVDGEPLATPAAACRGGIEHTFVLG